MKSKEGGTRRRSQFGPYGSNAAGEPSTKGFVTAERSSTLSTTLTLKGCKTKSKVIGSGENENGEKLKYDRTVEGRLKIPIAFHSNGSGGFEEGVVARRVVLRRKGTGARLRRNCARAERACESLRSGSEYVSVHERGRRNQGKQKTMEEFPAGFQAELEVEMELKNIVRRLRSAPSAWAKTAKVRNSTSGNVEFKNGKMEADVEEITIKHGNLYSKNRPSRAGRRRGDHGGSPRSLKHRFSAERGGLELAALFASLRAIGGPSLRAGRDARGRDRQERAALRARRRGERRRGPAQTGGRGEHRHALALLLGLVHRRVGRA